MIFIRRNLQDLARTSFNWLLIFCLIFSTTPLYANPDVLPADSQSPKFIEDILRHFQEKVPSIDLNNLDHRTDVTELSEKERASVQKVLSQPVQVGIEIMGLLTKLHQEFLKEEKKLGTDKLLEQITSRNIEHKIIVNIPEVGKAELNVFGLGKDAVVFTKIVHNGTNRTYLFLPPELDPAFLKKQLEREDLSKQERETFRKLLEQKEYYIARQLILTSNKHQEYKPLLSHPDNEKTVEKTRHALNGLSPEETKSLLIDLTIEKPNTKIKGRNTTVIFYNHGQFEKQRYERPDSKLSLEYWKTYWRSVYEKPTMVDVNMGIYMTSVQFGLAYAIGSLELATLSAIYGSILGVYSKTYVNWKLANDSQTVRTIKNWTIGMSFALTYQAVMHGFESFYAAELSTALMYLKWFSINFANNWAKTMFEAIPLARAKQGINLGEVSVFGVKFPKPSWEKQNMYLGSFVLKSASFTGIAATIPLIGTQVPIGLMLLWGSIPLMNYGLVRYTEKHGFKKAPEFRAQWERSKAFSIPYIMSIHESAKYVMNKYILSKLNIPYQGNTFYHVENLYQELTKEWRGEARQKFVGNLENIRHSLYDIQQSIQERIYHYNAYDQVNRNRHRMQRIMKENPIQETKPEVGHCRALFN